MKILPHHVSKIGALKARITHKVLGKNRHVGKKWAQNAPLLREDKKFPSLALYDPPQLRWKFSRITYIGDRSFEGKNYTQVFWEKSTRTRQKMGSECTICVHFSKIFPGEAPRTPTCGRGYPPPALSPCGASRRFGYAPRQWTLWIRYCEGRSNNTRKTMKEMCKYWYFRHFQTRLQCNSIDCIASNFVSPWEPRICVIIWQEVVNWIRGGVRSIFRCPEKRSHVQNKKPLKAVWPDCEALTFDLETWNLQGQSHKQRSQWKQLLKVCLHLMCERVIDHGIGTMKLNANYFFFFFF